MLQWTGTSSWKGFDVTNILLTQSWMSNLAEEDMALLFFQFVPTKKSAISEFSWSSYTAQPSFFPVHNSGRPSLAACEKGSQKPTHRSGFGWLGWWNLIEIEIFFWCERIHHISSRPRFGHWNPLQSGPSFIAFRKVKVKTWKDIVSSCDLYEVHIQQVRSKICWFEASKFYLNMTCWRNLMAVAAWNCPKHPYVMRLRGWYH